MSVGSIGEVFEPRPSFVVVYCSFCRRPRVIIGDDLKAESLRREPPPCPGYNDKRCGSVCYSNEPKKVAEVPLRWSIKDIRFLRALRIAIDADCASPE